MHFSAGRLKDRILAADPGATRLFMAARATGAVGISLAILAGIAHWQHLPLTVPLLGAALGMTWAIAVNDPTPREQRVSTLLLWLPAAAMLAIGTFTAPNRVLSDALFVVVLFASVYIRRFGPRGFSIGMVGVLAFFFSLFLRASFAMLPWLLLALAVTTACTYLLRFYLLPDRPEQAFRNAVVAFRARQRLIAATIEQAAARGSWTRRLERALNHHVFRLNETAIALDDVLRETQDGRTRAHVLDAELATAEMAERALRDPRTPIELPLLRVEAPPLHTGAWTPRGVFKAGTQVQTRFLQPTTRQALQLSLAAIPAIVAGELISPQRWYWAVLTTFVVFSGTTSAGDTLRKGWSRIAGTALGALAGVLVSGLVRGDHAAALALLFVFLFISVYGLRLSYAVMTFGITAVLSLLYVLLGLFTDQILVIRLVETAVGAAFGGTAALLVFPIRTQRVVQSVTAETLARLRTAADAVMERLEGETQADALEAVRAYDEAFQSLRAQLLPLIYTMRLRPDEVLRSRLLLFAACAYSLRALTRIVNESPEDCPMDAIRRLHAHVDAQIDVALKRLRGEGENASAPEPLERHGESGVLAHLGRIDRAVHRLAASF